MPFPRTVISEQDDPGETHKEQPLYQIICVDPETTLLSTQLKKMQSSLIFIQEICQGSSDHEAI